MQNFGENRNIKGVHNSLAMNDRQSITFLEDGNMMRLRRDETTGDVQIDHLMQIEVPNNQFTELATDAYLLDGVVAVRVNDNEFYFYIQPLVQSEPVQALPFSSDQSIADQAVNE